MTLEFLIINNIMAFGGLGKWFWNPVAFYAKQCQNKLVLGEEEEEKEKEEEVQEKDEAE